MNVLLINGSPHQTGCTYTALHEVEMTLQANGIETELLYLGKKPIAGCIACGHCMQSGCCFRDDIVQQVQKRLDEFDGILEGVADVNEADYYLRQIGAINDENIVAIATPLIMPGIYSRI